MPLMIIFDWNIGNGGLNPWLNYNCVSPILCQISGRTLMQERRKTKVSLEFLNLDHTVLLVYKTFIQLKGNSDLCTYIHVSLASA